MNRTTLRHVTCGYVGLILIHNGCGHVLIVPHIVVDGNEATGRSYALNIRWDADADRFWVARVSANTWRWVRTPQGWRIAERINANLDGTTFDGAILEGAIGLPSTITDAGGVIVELAEYR